MPYKRKYVKSKKKMMPKKRKVTKTTGTVRISYPKTVVDFGTNFPMKAKIKQTYTDTVTITSALGVINHYQMSLNGLYDPNITAAGHQPLYFDQMMAIYNHYTVIASKITCKVIPFEANTVPTSVILWQNDDNSITSSTVSTLQEQAGSSFTLCGSQGDNYTTLSLNYSPKKVFGGSLLANVNLLGSAASNPAESSYAFISIIGADNATTVSVIVQIIIEYVTIYSELKDIIGS